LRMRNRGGRHRQGERKRPGFVAGNGEHATVTPATPPACLPARTDDSRTNDAVYSFENGGAWRCTVYSLLLLKLAGHAPCFVQPADCKHATCGYADAGPRCGKSPTSRTGTQEPGPGSSLITLGVGCGSPAAVQKCSGRRGIGVGGRRQGRTATSAACAARPPRSTVKQSQSRSPQRSVPFLHWPLPTHSLQRPALAAAGARRPGFEPGCRSTERGLESHHPSLASREP
jgi:hypothetical protein